MELGITQNWSWFTKKSQSELKSRREILVCYIKTNVSLPHGQNRLLFFPSKGARDKVEQSRLASTHAYGNEALNPALFSLITD